MLPLAQRRLLICDAGRLQRVVWILLYHPVRLRLCTSEVVGRRHESPHLGLPGSPTSSSRFHSTKPQRSIQSCLLRCSDTRPRFASFHFTSLPLSSQKSSLSALFDVERGASVSDTSLCLAIWPNNSRLDDAVPRESKEPVQVEIP